VREANWGVACEWLFAELERLRGVADTPATWQSWCRAIRGNDTLLRTLCQSPITARALAKPRGYAGDAVLMDLMYGLAPPGVASPAPIGTEIFAHEYRRPAARAVRARRRLLADFIDRGVEQGAVERVAAVAAGHLREAPLSAALTHRRVRRVVAMDQDAESLAVIQRDYGHLGVSCVRADLRDLARARAGDDRFDLIYSTGLYDYLSDRLARRLTRALLGRLRPGGTLLIANFAPDLPDRGYLEAIMDWHHIYRDEAACRNHLASDVPRRVVTFRDTTGHIVFMEVQVPE
jgi:SAM-dependent methyltransferase